MPFIALNFYTKWAWKFNQKRNLQPETVWLEQQIYTDQESFTHPLVVMVETFRRCDPVLSQDLAGLRQGQGQACPFLHPPQPQHPFYLSIFRKVVCRFVEIKFFVVIFETFLHEPLCQVPLAIGHQLASGTCCRTNIVLQY